MTIRAARRPALAFRLPIRWRLTVWYALLLAAALALFAGALYFGLRQRLYAGLDEQLVDQAALTLRSIDVSGDRPNMDHPALELEDGEYYLRLLNAEGQVVLETRGDEDIVPPGADVFAAARTGQTVFSDAPDSEDETTRVVSVPIRGDAGSPPVGVLQVGLDRDEIDEPLNELVRALALAVPLVSVLAGASGYLLAGRALAPVAAITTLAGNIGAGDLGARLNLDGPDDELGRLARTFDAMLARIDDAFERQRRFTGDAAHELRTPLSLMRAQVDLALARPRSNAEYQEALRDLDGDLARLTGLVGTLLTLARADAGRLAIEREPFDLATTIELVLAQYGSLAETSGVTLRQETEPAPLLADEDLLLQLLVNLIDNALAHTPPGGIVAVGCQPRDGSIALWVDDTGEGVAPEHQPRIFDRFYRGDSGRARAQGGAGLGLAISRAIVEGHGGVIAVTSEPGRGTRIDMLLPVGLVERAEAASPGLHFWPIS